MAGAISYEEQRRRNVEANNRKMEELKLHYLSAVVPEAVPKPSPDTLDDFERKTRRGRSSSTTREDLINRVYASDEAREYAINKAYELQEKLGSDYPSFVKPMTQSHVSGGFWLGLPRSFCRKYLPNKGDVWIDLVDEEGADLPTLYLPLKTGLSVQWRKFAMDHGLVDGDCLVFEVIERTKFRVYIIRQSSYYEN